MKKSIICLGVALITATNVSLASNVSSLPNVLHKVQFDETMSPLSIAIWKGDVLVVKKMIEYGSDVNQKSNGLTPLMFAARYNRVEIIKLLLSKGARLNEKDVNGMTALKYAELSNAKESVALLKEM